MISRINYQDVVPKLNYTDLSPSRSAEVVRQIQQLREDVRATGNGIAEEIKQPKGNLNSPYAPERAGEQKILGTDLELAWKRRLDLIY